ncbi:hypothetical protein BD289DRAFT_439169 [Coniella lustricola]|uniref:Uncharacterized protein n=1 Tax=Coniella lustricola TaxID=2025994 RepID=A0A2T3A250_9PEZI|nr:hypothetical protein BD289DRAFT_439169 [Coniella lustricola]
MKFFLSLRMSDFDRYSRQYTYGNTGQTARLTMPSSPSVRLLIGLVLSAWTVGGWMLHSWGAASPVAPPPAKQSKASPKQPGNRNMEPQGTDTLEISISVQRSRLTSAYGSVVANHIGWQVVTMAVQYACNVVSCFSQHKALRLVMSSLE